MHSWNSLTRENSQCKAGCALCLHHLLLPSQGFISLSFDYLFSQLSSQVGRDGRGAKGWLCCPCWRAARTVRALLCALSASGMLELLSKALGVQFSLLLSGTVSDQIIQYKTLYSFIMHKKHYLEKVTCI